jgi:hypothetical protein
MIWIGYVARISEMRNAYKKLVGRHEGKISLERSARNRKNYMKMNLKKTGWEGVYWINLAKDSDRRRVLVNVFNETSGSIKVG